MSLEDDIKPGTDMCINFRSRFSRLLSTKVVRTTPTQIVTEAYSGEGEVKWRRKDGRRVGMNYYDSPELLQWTPELRAKQRRETVTSELQSAFHEFERDSKHKHDVDHLELVLHHLRSATSDADVPRPRSLRASAHNVVEYAEAGDSCLMCGELLDRPENDLGDGEYLGHRLDCPVAALAEALQTAEVAKSSSSKCEDSQA